MYVLNSPNIPLSHNILASEFYHKNRKSWQATTTKNCLFLSMIAGAI